MSSMISRRNATKVPEDRPLRPSPWPQGPEQGSKRLHTQHAPDYFPRMTAIALREHAADRWVHLLGLGLGPPAALGVVAVAALNGAQGQLASVALYAAGLLAMLGCSAAYHLRRPGLEDSSPRSEWLRR